MEKLPLLAGQRPRIKSRYDPKRTIMDLRCLEIFGPESGVLGDASKHLGADFLSVMKCEDEIWPTFAPEGAM